MKSVQHAQKRYELLSYLPLSLSLTFLINQIIYLKILEAYDENHLSFVKQVLKDPLYLEEITGLAAMKKESESLLDDWDIENDDEDDF